MNLVVDIITSIRRKETKTGKQWEESLWYSLFVWDYAEKDRTNKQKKK